MGCRASSASTSRPAAWTRPASSSSAAGSSELAGRGSAVLVATHDVEFAARLASRVVLLGDGELIADGPADEILSGGWYFATEVARILGAPGAITPEAGAALLPGARGDRARRRWSEPVSWQVAVFAGLALVLIGGFWWYERARPSARLVALVAALAALAVAGRLVLTPIPNVVATTDIALITGYALGAGPGFAVGALAAPISNIWLGQGPWTAWEMAGWGLVGLGGAWLAALTRRRLGRLGLAVVCGLAGFAYGALLDLSVMVTYGGEQSLDRYLALSARGIPFNVAHAAGNFADRARRRPGAGADDLPLPHAARVHLAPGGRDPAGAGRGARGRAGRGRRAEPRRGRARRRRRGSSARRTPTAASPPPAGQPSSPAMTGWAMLGLEAAGTNPLDLERGGENPVSYLRTRDRPPALGRRPRAHDPRPRRRRRRSAPLRRPRPGRRAAHAPRRRRLGRRPGQPDRLLRAGDARRWAPTPSSLKRSAAWLRRAQNADGGWGIQPQAPSEADSTGASLQGLVAAGCARQGRPRAGPPGCARPSAPPAATRSAAAGSSTRSRPPGRSRASPPPGGGGKAVGRALGYLGRLRAADGHYRYSPTSDQTPIWVTAQVLLAVERAPFPLATVTGRADAVGRRRIRVGGRGGRRAAAVARRPRRTRASRPASPGGGRHAPSPRAATRPGGGDGAPSSGPDAPVSSDAGATPAGRAPTQRRRRPAPSRRRRPTSRARRPGGRPGRLSVGVGLGQRRDHVPAPGAGVLAVAAVAGFAWYRRRAP